MRNNIREFQLELLKMLIELDRILKENKLPYFLLGGSVLGAIRHKGFIPWDDDIDIGLCRKDFEKLEKILQEKLPKNLHYCEIGNKERNLPPIGFLHDAKNENIPLEKVHTIDIFPIDNVPDNKIMEKVQNIFSQVYHLCVYRKPAKNRGKIAYFFTKCILNIFPNFLLDFLQNFSKKVITKYKDRDTKYVNNLFGANFEKVRKEVMKTSILMDFEGRKFPIPILYDEYLTILYGDYMKMPDENKRQPKHKDDIFN